MSDEASDIVRSKPAEQVYFAGSIEDAAAIAGAPDGEFIRIDDVDSVVAVDRNCLTQAAQLA